MTALTKEQRKAWNTLKDPHVDKRLHDNSSVVREMQYIRKTGKYTNRMGEFLYLVANDRADGKRFKGYSFKVDMVHFAILIMLVSLNKVDLTKGYHLRSYLQQCCESAFINYISKENKQGRIKQDILEQIQVGSV